MNINRKLDENKRMLEGNIARIILTDDLKELHSMQDWAHKRIDEIVEIRERQINEKIK